MRFKRAFSFYPFKNLLAPPKVKIENNTYHLLEYSYIRENTGSICLGQITYDEANRRLLIGMSEGFLDVKKVSDHGLDNIFLKYSSSLER